MYAKNGRFGPYVQWGSPDQLPPGLDKPKMSSLFKTMVLERITVDEAEALLQLPRSVGVDPADSQEIVASNGRYGPYVVKGKDFRSLDNEEQLLTITLDQASAIFQQPKVYKRGGRNMAPSGPLREFGTDPVSQRLVTAKDGRFGVYVTDGETNASIGKGDRIEEMLPERAYELLAIRRDVVATKGGSTGKPAARKKAPAKRKPKKAGGQEAVAARRVNPQPPERLAFDHKRGRLGVSMMRRTRLIGGIALLIGIGVLAGHTPAPRTTVVATSRSTRCRALIPESEPGEYDLTEADAMYGQLADAYGASTAVHGVR